MVSYLDVVLFFQNLVFNSLKYCGDVYLEIFIEGSVDEEKVVVIVIDNGFGIFYVECQCVFEFFVWFYVVDEIEGLGFGFVICCWFVERYGGMIELDGELGRGMEVFFIFMVIEFVFEIVQNLLLIGSLQNDLNLIMNFGFILFIEESEFEV